MNKPVIILNVVGLSPRHFERPDLIPNLARFKCRPMRPTFPAVTCSMQATLLSGKPPSAHGIIANGYFDRDTYEVKFWEQPAALVQAPRLWDLLPGKKTAVLFWQNSMFINADIVVTPRPLHLDSGLLQWCYSKPAGYYERLAAAIGDFKLQHYWGPVAGLGSSRWIADAAKWTYRHERPDLMLVYLPHLDYSSQKFGPSQPAALREIDTLVGELLQEFRDATVIICSEYALTPVTGALYPNRQLRAAGLLRCREIAGKEYLDYELSDAFAMVDHQLAHIYCKPGKLDAARAALPGVEFTTLAHPRAGELIAVAPADKWFAYYWWEDWNKAPEFAYTVDIHRKPGYDPCELWFDYGRMARTFKLATGTNPALVKGSHGRVGDDPRDWAVLLTQEDLGLPDQVTATDLAPLVSRLLR
ncbi:MAG: nucleotide pyrophosphatase/phosphodiesterase family protein [Verrucomicrobiota bacterium]